MKMFQRLLSTMALLALAACGGGGGGSGNTAFGGGSGGGTGGGGGGTIAPNITLQLSLLDQSGAATPNILAGQPLRAQAVLRRNGDPVANEIVQFQADQGSSLVRVDPTAGTQLTDSDGVAVVTVSSLGTDSGAGRITASASVSGIPATSSANFFASGSTTTQPPSLTLSGLEIGSTAVSAYGTTGLRVRVLQANAPYTAGVVTVNFTSSCPAGKATVTANASTQPDGYAVATFVDNGCAQTADTTVTITASIATDSKSGSLTVRSPTTGSLRFISVVPSDKSITLRGQGGNGRQENATVTFQLVDVAGQGVGDADVCFDSSTYIGGLNIDGFGPGSLPGNPGSVALCGSDSLSVVRYVKRTNPDGTVTLQVNSGTVPTPVRVRARALYPATATTALESFSDTLSVSTGLPLQRSFSLSVDKANIDGGNFDGEVSTLTVRLADQFSNPVPDGTVINFIGSGGAVCTSNNGSCRTTNGACSCNVVSQARRPQDNRIVVTAYAVGLEDFDDRNGDNLYTAGTDPFYDLGDAYLDANKDGLSNSLTINGDTDILIPYQNPNQFTQAGDGVRGTAHIRASTVIYLSQSSSLGSPTAVIPLNVLSQQNSLATNQAGGYFVRLPPICPSPTPVPQAAISLYLEDGIGNPMAAGTGLAVLDQSDNVSTGGFRPASVLAIGARAPNALIDLPNVPKSTPWATGNTNVVATVHGVTVRGVQDKCSGNGSFALQVTSPRGGAATAAILFEGEPRPTPGTPARGTIPVNYTNLVNFTATPNGSRSVQVTGQSWVNEAGGASTPTSVSVSCGGSGGTFSAPGSTSGTCTYGAGGVAVVTYTVNYAGPGGTAASVSNTATVTVAP
jgi:hypothetical protein